MSQERELSQ